MEIQPGLTDAPIPVTLSANDGVVSAISEEQKRDAEQSGLVVVDQVLSTGSKPEIQKTIERHQLHMTKRAFQNRFPKMPNGVSTKYDAMSMFLHDDHYAKMLGMEGRPLVELRMLINTGVNRLRDSLFVDYEASDPKEFTFLLMQQFVPEEFRLTVEERDRILALPLSEEEIYKGAS